MSTKKVFFLLISLVLTLSFGLPDASFAQSPKPILLKYHDPSKAGTSRTKAVEETLLEIEKRSGGRVKHELYWAESLMKAKDALKGLQAGACEVAEVHTVTYHPSRFPAWQFSQLLFVGGNDVDAVAKACNEMADQNPVLKKEFDATGLIFLATSPLTPTNFISRVPLKDLKDFQGLKIRAIGPVGKWVASLGASATPLTFYELNEAISRKLIDVVQSYTYVSHAYKFYESCKYMPLNGISHIFIDYWINKDALTKLPPDVQKIYLSTWQDFYLERLVKHTDEENDQQLEDFKKAGVNMYSLTPQQLAKWKESVQPINNAYFEEMRKKGVDGQKIVTDYQALYNKYERKK